MENPTHKPVITFSTAIYELNSKFSPTIYNIWMKQFFSIVQQQLYLVVYTDDKSYSAVQEAAANNPFIKVVIRPLEQFHGMIYKDFWKKNHTQNYLLNNRICWEVNMLWNEKVWFVNETIQHQVFPETVYYGWCDIGYFRNSQNNVHTSSLKGIWGNPYFTNQFNPQQIHYALVNPAGFKHMMSIYLEKNVAEDEIFRIKDECVSRNPLNTESFVEIPPDQVSIAGGFFFGGKDTVLWWKDVLTQKLEKKYISNSRLVKDDQIIVLDCIMEQLKENTGRIQLHENQNPYLDPWFLFQTLLSSCGSK